MRSLPLLFVSLSFTVVHAQEPSPLPLSEAELSAVLGTTTQTLMRHETELKQVKEPLAGYANGNFFIRDPHDWFVIFPKGRVQIDSYFFPARGDRRAGVEPNAQADTRPDNTIFIRRARAEVQGTFLGHFDFHISGEFASTPALGSFGTVSDCFVIIDYLSYLKVQVGHFNAPFMLENRTSNKIIDYMERSLAVRAFGIPQNKDTGLMLWGWLPKKVARYEVGIFNGEGVQSIRNQDNQPLILGRAFIAPLAPLALAQKHKWMENIWIGGSFWWQRNQNLGFGPGNNIGSVSGGAQNDLPGMTTQGGVSFFSSSYSNGRDPMMNAIRSHLVPDGQAVKGAFELNVPVKYAGVRMELVYQDVGMARYDDINPSNALIRRSGRVPGANLKGIGTYLEVYGWIKGDTSFLSGYGNPEAPRIKKFAVAPEPKWGLMVAAKYEHIGFDIGNLAGPTDPASGMPIVDPAVGHYQLDAFELGINAWATKHVRLTANYVLNYISGDAPNVKSNFYYEKFLHELLFRVGIAL